MKHLLLLIFYLPLMVFGQDRPPDWENVKRYAVENENLKSTTVVGKRIVFMGNSITEGWKTLDGDFFARNSYINRGINGQVTTQMLRRFKNDVVDLKPSVVVILAGINDIAENDGPIALEKIFDNIVSMAAMAKANNIRIVLSSVLPANEFPWRAGLKPADKIIALNAMVKAYADQHQIVYADYYPEMVDGKKGLDKKYSEDGVHPNLAGYTIMESLVEKAIAAALTRD